MPVNERGLWLPPSHVIHNREPKWMCTLCPAVFFEDEYAAYEKHCADPRIHGEAEINERSLRHQAPGLFDPRHPDYNDIEWAKWIERNAALGRDPEKYMRTDDGKHSSGLGDGA